MSTKGKVVKIQSNNRSYSEYTRGSTAPAPKVNPREPGSDEAGRERQKRFEHTARNNAVKRGIRQRYAQVNVFNRRELLMVAVLLVCMVASCVFWLSQESALSAAIRQVGTSRSQYSALIHSNDVLENSINLSIDNEEIYRRASEEMGMRYPEKYQIVYYNKAEEGMVHQADEIPAEIPAAE